MYFKKYIVEISLQICLIGIISTFIANTAKMAFPKGNKSEIRKSNPIQREVLHTSIRQLYEAYGSVCAKV